MVSTGDDSQLSAPITFESIRERILQPRRNDCPLKGIEAVRVSLATAVEFITNLQRREDAASPSIEPRILDTSLNPDDHDAPSAELWADHVLKHADDVKNRYTVEAALDRVLRARVGDHSRKLAAHPFNRTWK
ncbi:uncharacterized protein LY89DRAFT_689732 [Mollisia scopiformis]|uniref:Uncharacterized protein n=1 Tax=Mollisia scopiformis TaxID=149040 RepID=A0A132BF67_MOLSC|nr:uncharacterized protein LY89DRAFT_689732 [Mollisia scopiformis]KUJ10514.1 hypothetical protein LY89DRAFT_689732 [Mollisia scopiformis]